MFLSQCALLAVGCSALAAALSSMFCTVKLSAGVAVGIVGAGSSSSNVMGEGVSESDGECVVPECDDVVECDDMFDGECVVVEMCTGAGG